MAKKRNPQDAYQIQIRSLKKRVAELEKLERRIRVLEHDFVVMKVTGRWPSRARPHPTIPSIGS